MNSIIITIVFDNTTLRADCTPEWGFACVIESPAETILFDTGNDGQILLANLKALGFGETRFSKIIISHMHWDHCGGLQKILQLNPDATVYFPASATPAEREKSGAKNYVLVKEAQEVNPHVHTLGEMPGRANEQSLAVITQKGLVVITGCAHPGIVEILKAARTLFPDEKIYLSLGGFHLNQHSDEQVRAIVAEFKSIGVERAAPTHCTGDDAIQIFAQEYDENYVKAGVGLRIEFDVLNK
ncbi:MBL fold metallo-hydrolase [candidate division KSB1 bacterium]|nr:MBL fold metallo-hydrolase [candidate division KSB1 bacterium]